jgi:hypothetical protein
VVTRFVPADLIQKIAAAAFIVVGVVMLLRPD